MTPDRPGRGAATGATTEEAMSTAATGGGDAPEEEEDFWKKHGWVVDPAVKYRRAAQGELIAGRPPLTAGSRIVRRTPCDLSPAICLYLLSLRGVKGEIPVKDIQVECIIRDFRDRQFTYETVHLATARLKGTETVIRINGRHTSLAYQALRAKEPDFPHRPVEWIEYEVDDEAAAYQLWASFDQGQRRGQTSVLHGELQNIDEWDNTPKRVVTHLTAGFKLWRFESAGERARRVDDVVPLLRSPEFSPAVMAVRKFSIDHGTFSTIEWMNRGPVYGAMLATWHTTVDKAAAARFWDSVRSGVGLTSESDPALRLRTKLSENNLANSTVKAVKKNVTSPEVMYRWGLLAWNSYRLGRPMSARGLHVKTEDPRPPVIA